ncbi:MAG: PD40 domain-containing protein [Bacteroidetes bacterium]|nr:PD40 domain-containing protein [Bacteroidota bacterium]
MLRALVWMTGLLCCTGLCRAQPATPEEQRAFMYLQQGDFANARLAYEAAVRADSASFPAWLGLGMSLKQLGSQAEALGPFARAFALDSTRTPALYLYLGDAYMFNLRYPEAAHAYTQFLRYATDFRDQKEHARRNLRKAQWAALRLADSIAFVPQNLGPAVNGEGEDYNAFLSADDSTLYFNSHRKGNTGGPVPGIFHGYGSDFYYSTLTAEGWQTAQNAGLPLNSALHEKEFYLSPDGQELYFGRHPLRPSSDGHYSCGIWYSRREQGRWTEPRKLEGSISSGYCDSWPSLSADGRTLYFVSDRPGGFGGFDIWYATRLPNGQWGAVQNLGHTLNTPGDEFDVFIHPDDSTLYFTSDYHPGFGGFDIYRSRRQANGRWGSPENLGYPLNTPWDEFDMFVNAAGTTGYINSDRWGGHGEQDLYRFSLDDRIRPRPTFWLKGHVTDAADMHQQPEATVRLVALGSGDTLRTLAAGKLQNGHFLTAMPRGDSYAVITTAPRYLPHSLHYAPPDQANGWLDIPLQPLAKDAVFTLRNIFFDTDQATLRPESRAELQLLTQLLHEHPQLRLEVQGHTDSQGTSAANETLSQRRAAAVQTYLTAQGIAAHRLTAVGFGQRQPVVSNDTPQGRQLNRRVSFRVLAY